MLEKRYNAELRATEGKLVGYAAVYGSLSEDLGGFREVLTPSAFERTLKENPDILALADHDTSKVLARTTNGTLRISSDQHGLKVEIDPANTTYARDLLELVRRGDVAGMSFAFRPYPGGSSFDPERGIRTLTSVELREVSVVVSPAYEATSISVRALREALQDRLAHTLRQMRLRLAERN